MRNKLFILASIGLFLFATKNDAQEASLKIAVLGTGKIAGEKELYSTESLEKILQAVKTENPDLVIFTGDLIQGLEQSTSSESLKKLEDNLNTFYDTIKTHLGSNIPLYPIMGNHTFVNTEAINIFKTHFNIKNTAPLESYQLAYSITLKNVKLTFLATGLFETPFKTFSGLSHSMPLLDWVEKNIRTDTDENTFQFVIGHEPAYSPNAAEGVYSGLDKNPETRNQLWNILKNNRVLAYLCSHELMYDRSNHKDVWQIISGGIGDPKRIKTEQTMFRHFILISIPETASEDPVVRAIDINGKDLDRFRMNRVGEPVQHLRISQN